MNRSGVRFPWVAPSLRRGHGHPCCGGQPFDIDQLCRGARGRCFCCAQGVGCGNPAACLQAFVLSISATPHPHGFGATSGSRSRRQAVCLSWSPWPPSSAIPRLCCKTRIHQYIDGGQRPRPAHLFGDEHCPCCFDTRATDLDRRAERQPDHRGNRFGSVGGHVGGRTRGAGLWRYLGTACSCRGVGGAPFRALVFHCSGVWSDRARDGGVGATCRSRDATSRSGFEWTTHIQYGLTLLA